MSPHIIFLVPIVVSVILLILSLNVTATIYNDTFDYLRTLPYYYWIGLSLLILSVILYIKYDLPEYYSIPLIVLFAIYAHNRVIIINELPISHQDIFLHSAEIFPILYSGFIDSSFGYSSNYPLAFILMAILALINGLKPFVLFSIWELFIGFIIPLFIYLISKTLIAKPLSIIPVIVFISLVYTNIEHFSPQSFTIGIYILIVFFIIKSILLKKDIFTLPVLLLIICVAFGNPTNSFFLLTLFLFSSIVLIFRNRINISNHTKQNVKLVYVLLLLTLILGVTLLVKDINSMFIVPKVISRAEELINVNLVDITEDIKITPNPAPSYIYHVTLKTIFSIIVVGAGLITVGYFMYGIRKEHAILLAIFVGILLFSMAVTSVTATFLFTRSYTYTVMIWPILAVYIVTHLSSYRRIFLGLFIILIVASLILLPITKFGKLPTAYSSYSSYYALNVLINNQTPYNTGLIGVTTLPFVYKYLTSFNNDKTASTKITQLGFLINKKVSDGTDKTELYNILTEKVHSRTFIVFSQGESNILRLQYQLEDIYSHVEDFVCKKENLIINSSTSKIYMS